MPEEQKLLQVYQQMTGVLCQVWRNQQLYAILPDYLIPGSIAPPGHVGIDRYLSSGTGSSG